jgi:hypothetical protein
VKALNELIESRQKELRAAALKLGSRLYAGKPAVNCRQWVNYWNTWRDAVRRKQKRRSDKSKRL